MITSELDDPSGKRQKHRTNDMAFGVSCVLKLVDIGKTANQHFVPLCATYRGNTMNAIEIEAPIINHQITICSDHLPAQVNRAKVIVLFETAEQPPSRKGALASLRANPAQPRGDGLPMTREALYDRTSLR